MIYQTCEYNVHGGEVATDLTQDWNSFFVGFVNGMISTVNFFPGSSVTFAMML